MSDEGNIHDSETVRERLARVEQRIESAKNALEQVRDRLDDSPDLDDMQRLKESHEEVEERVDTMWFWFRVLQKFVALAGFVVGSGLLVIVLDIYGVL